jgi:hypothetical protein
MQVFIPGPKQGLDMGSDLDTFLHSVLISPLE